MNWYLKTSGIEDFYSGTLKHDIDSFPDNEQDLSEEQKSYLRGLTTHDMYVMDKVMLFKKFPSYIFITLYDISKYILYRYGNKQTWNQDIEHIINLVKNKDWRSSICDHLPNRFYELIMEDPNGWKINEEDVKSIIQYESDYPQFFLNWINENYPELFAAKRNDKNSQISIVRNFLIFGSKHNYNIMQIMASALYPKYETEKEEKRRFRIKRDQLFSELTPEILNHEKRLKNIQKAIHRLEDGYYGRYYSGKGKDLYELLYFVISNYKAGEDFIDEECPFILFFDYPGKNIGKIPMIFFLKKRIQFQYLEKLMELAEQNPEEYVTVRLDDSQADLLFMVDGNEENPVVLGEIVGERPTYDSYRKEGPILACLETMKPTANIKAQLYLQWFEEKLKIAKAENKEEEFFFEFIHSDTFSLIIEDASEILGALYISQNKMINAKDYDPEQDYDWRTKLPFGLDLANQIMDVVPSYFITQSVDKTFPTWYTLCSGKFPCNIVAERAMKYPSDTMKIIEFLSCKGSKENIEHIRETVRKKAQEAKREAQDRIETEFTTFTSNPENCRIATLSDFPSVYSYTLDLVNKHFDKKEESWSSRKQKYMSIAEITLQRLEDLVIYLINEQKIIDFFGEETLTNSGLSPKEAKGIFCPRYSVSSDHDSIIVFLKDYTEKTKVEMIINDVLGLKPSEGDKINKVTEEETLWHEIAHAVMSHTISHDETKNPSQWLRSPSELIAIQYGNLQYLKQKLRTFFENNVPASAKIEAGLMSYIEATIIETFSWEFQGMPKEQALASVRQNMEDFKEQVASSRTAMTKEEVVNLLTSIFLRFLMEESMRGKAESEIEEMKRLIGTTNSKITFKEDVVVPETYEYRMPGEKDEIIKELETRPDYQKFIIDVKNRIAEMLASKYDRQNDRLRFYLHKGPEKQFKEPREFPDLLALMFEPPATVVGVDTKRINSLFYSLIPVSLKNDVIDIIERKRALMSVPMKEDTSLVTPEEAEETGRFMVEMDEEYGPDWVWTAGKKDWYKTAIKTLKE